MRIIQVAKKKGFPLLPLLCVISPALLAVSNTEGERKSQKVTYFTGDSAEVNCDRNYACIVSVTFNGKKYSVDRKSINNVRILPGQVTLFWSKRTGGNFSVEFESECGQYAKFTPAYICVTSVHFKEGVINEISHSKRTYSDSPGEMKQ
jgi:hypothetical protein